MFPKMAQLVRAELDVGPGCPATSRGPCPVSHSLLLLALKRQNTAHMFTLTSASKDWRATEHAGGDGSANASIHVPRAPRLTSSSHRETTEPPSQDFPGP